MFARMISIYCFIVCFIIIVFMLRFQSIDVCFIGLNWDMTYKPGQFHRSKGQDIMLTVFRIYIIVLQIHMSTSSMYFLFPNSIVSAVFLVRSAS